jgi:hypothetical protein
VAEYRCHWRHSALSAEESYVADQLETASCLTDWGANEGAANKEAAVTDLTPRGVYVSVSLSYAYTTQNDNETIHADTASKAVYEVTLNDTRRISGDDISPC